MKNYKIEKGVALPKIRTGRPREYPWLEMEVGDSVMVDKKPNVISANLNHLRKVQPERKYTYRTVEGGVRVWRIK